jgi:hypothetical protein
MGSRAARRIEARWLSTEIDTALAPDDSEWMAALSPPYDGSDCQHGCNGWPCGSGRCTFTCHEGLPVFS